VIATNLSGWRRPSTTPPDGSGDFADTAWSRCRIDSAYPEGGWYLPIEERELPWQIRAIDISPSIVREEDGTPIILSWDGDSANPRIVAFDMGSGDELDAGYRIGPDPVVQVAVVAHTGRYS
jgi:hypothetical protein